MLNESASILKELVHLDVAGSKLTGDLSIPENPSGLVIFSHGSGSSRLSPRNKFVAEVLQKKNIATLLFDLLTEQEDLTYENRFNIELLSERLIEVTEMVEEWPSVKNLPLGYFGASTGAASALKAAAYFGDKVKAVVSRGGRPDLAMEALPKVTANVLLIVGGDDVPVIGMNREAFRKLNTVKEMQIIPGATHLFEEPGKLEQVAETAAKWYHKYFMRA